MTSTLWPGSDRASADFMTHFYRHLHERKNVAGALRLAQNDLRRDPAYASPLHWAA